MLACWVGCCCLVRAALRGSGVQGDYLFGQVIKYYCTVQYCPAVLFVPSPDVFMPDATLPAVIGSVRTFGVVALRKDCSRPSRGLGTEDGPSQSAVRFCAATAKCTIGVACCSCCLCSSVQHH